MNEPEIYIGVDESGKGDFFGPLVIAGFLVTPEIKDILIQIEVRDSKSISDNKIKKIAEVIQSEFNGLYDIVKINPEKYNKLYSKMRNLNTLLAWGHARCIENILMRHKVTIAICDQFGNENFIRNALMKEGKQIELVQTHNAERFIGVAAASILARKAFLEWFEKVDKELGIKLPLGTNQTVKEVARKVADKVGKDSLKKYVKTHFKTMNEL